MLLVFHDRITYVFFSLIIIHLRIFWALTISNSKDIIVRWVLPIFVSMLSTVCMGVVVLTRWLWMQQIGPPHLSPVLLHPLYLPHPLPHSSLCPLAQPLLPLWDHLSTPHLPPCPSPSAIGLTLSPLPGGLLPHPALVKEDLPSLDPLLAPQDPLFLQTPQFLFHQPAPRPSPWAHLGLTTKPPPHPLCPLLPERMPDSLPLLPGSHHLGISSVLCMSVCKHTKTITLCEPSDLKLAVNWAFGQILFVVCFFCC